ncbi:hypothetical protein [Neobacillus thermocopriae]|uniref:Uncharacterized protein n=1 Tax=Neobacillus thermocopriae TaxID=1215031 RepID=A0A6B3TV39_9BACI|nr:hypothetical protein [Neobacillus thermocopriae]NEX80209.1 hypothetical protein [Neobacillus thermocopriae]
MANKLKNLKLSPPTKEFIEHILMKKFKAIEIPLYSIHPDDYKNDDEVDESKIYKLFTITNPDILNKICNNEEKEIFEDERNDKTEIDVPRDEITNNNLIDEHNKGYRISIVLESEDGIHVSHAGVYGFSEYLTMYLVALIGLPKREMVLNNVNDRGFQFNLECLKKHNFIS